MIPGTPASGLAGAEHATVISDTEPNVLCWQSATSFDVKIALMCVASVHLIDPSQNHALEL
jgi:hypothetical protein